MAIELAECLSCKGGLILNPSTGKVENCPTCHGIGLTTPETICHCGRSCADVQDKLYYCGNPECLKALKESKRLDSYRSEVWQRPHTSYTPTSRAAVTQPSFYDDPQDPEFAAWRDFVH